ncbi:MAG: formylglycine-generating enzyme family protein [Bacteroidota bacterium]|nr:formylglycine-generating enzyme family protein [Bacteroidota bacterium]
MKRVLTILLLGSFVSAFGQAKPLSKNMVPIKGGVYLPLYSLDSQKVAVKGFSMDIYPVTNADFLLFVKKYPEWKRSKVKPLFADSNYLHHWFTDSTFDKQVANSPVVNVSWFAAKKYCEWQGKRLPTIAEWELVAKASKTKANASKDPAFNQWVLNWVSKPSSLVLPNVGSTFKNYYGVYDIHGLVWEWTYDFNSALTTGESRGDGSLDNTFFCGGGSFASKDINNYASFMRFAMRSSVKAKYGVPNLGFRCVK